MVIAVLPHGTGTAQAVEGALGQAVLAVEALSQLDDAPPGVGLTLERQAEVISTAVGGRGPNSEYLWNVADHLRDLGLGDADLDWLSDRVREIVGADGAPKDTPHGSGETS